MNLIQLALAAETLTQDRPPLTVEVSRCQHTRDKTSPCELCVQGCPAGAISLQPGLHLDEARCIRCGLCIHQCPAGVFDGPEGIVNLLTCVANLSEHKIIEIACKHHPDPAKGIRDVDAVVQISGCLSALGVSACVGLLALGVEQVRARLDACEGCPLRLLRPAIEGILTRANDIVAAGSFAGQVMVAEEKKQRWKSKRPVYSDKNPPLSRRGFFKMLTLQPNVAVEYLAQRHEPQVEGSFSVPRDRRRLIRALAALSSLNQEAVIEDNQFMMLEVDDRCTACGVCARICPTGALTINKMDDTFELRFRAADCMNCRLCLDRCENHALHRAGSPRFAEIIHRSSVVLQSGTLQHCVKCHATFSDVSEGGLCPVCAARWHNPFSVNLPASLLEKLPEHLRAKLQSSSTSTT